MISWVFAISAIVALLMLIARETDTKPYRGLRIALMLLPAAAFLLLMPLRTRDPWPHPLAVGTLALTWLVLSGLHPGQIWRDQGAPGRKRAFAALWAAIAIAIVVFVIETG